MYGIFHLELNLKIMKETFNGSFAKEQRKIFNLKRLKSNPLIVAQIIDLAQRKGWK